MKIDQKRIQVNFQGRVQGVGFRYTVVSLSHTFSVTGYVKNLGDGSVELVAEGNEDELLSFVREILSSGLQRYIFNHTVFWENARGAFNTFGVAY